jgi:hypothetical protein
LAAARAATVLKRGCSAFVPARERTPAAHAAVSCTRATTRRRRLLAVPPRGCGGTRIEEWRAGEKNARDLDEIPAEVLKDLEVILASNMDDVLENALEEHVIAPLESGAGPTKNVHA